MQREQALALIDQERSRQSLKWGEQAHPLPYWMCILGEEFGEVAKEITERPDAWTEELKEELVQLAAVAVQMLEKFED